MSSIGDSPGTFGTMPGGRVGCCARARIGEKSGAGGLGSAAVQEAARISMVVPAVEV